MSKNCNAAVKRMKASHRRQSLTPSEYALMMQIYCAERKQKSRNYAKDHSFSEWLANRLTVEAE